MSEARFLSRYARISTDTKENQKIQAYSQEGGSHLR